MPNKTFYFTQQNLDKLMSEEIPNRTLNMIVSNYYAANARVSLTELVTSPEKKKKFEELKSKYPPLEIKTDFASEIKHPMEQTIAPPEYGA